MLSYATPEEKKSAEQASMSFHLSVSKGHVCVVDQAPHDKNDSSSVFMLDRSVSMRSHYTVMAKVGELALQNGATVINFACRAAIVEEYDDRGRPVYAGDIGYLTSYSEALKLALECSVAGQPVIFMTDGEPNSGDQWVQLAEELRKKCPVTAYYLGYAEPRTLSNMRQLCSQGQEPTFMAPSNFEDIMQKSLGSAVRTESKDGRGVAGEFGATFATEVPSGSCALTSRQDTSVLAGASAAIVALLTGYTRTPAYDAALVLATVKTLNAVLGGASGRDAYGLTELSSALRELAGKAGSRDTDVTSVAGLLQAAGVTSFVGQHDQERLRNAMEASKVFMANNRRKKAILKTKARQDTTTQWIQKCLREVSPFLLQPDAFPKDGLLGAPIRFPDGLADKLPGATDAAACAVIRNPQCLDVRVGPVVKVKSLKVSEGQEHEGPVLLDPVLGLPASQLVTLLVYHGTGGTVCSRLAPLMLLNAFFDDNAWREARALDIVLANVAQTVDVPFNILRDNAKPKCWGYAAALAQYSIEARFALLAPLISPDPLHHHELLVHALMAVVWQATRGPTAALPGYDALRGTWVAEFPGTTPQETLQSLSVGDATVPGLAMQLRVDLQQFDEKTEQEIVEKLAEMLDAARAANHRPDGIASPYVTSSGLARVLGAIRAGSAVAAQRDDASSLQDMCRDDRDIRRAVVEAVVRVVLLCILHGGRPSVAAGAMLAEHEVVDKDGLLCMGVPPDSEDLRRELLDEYLRDAKFPIDLDTLVMLAERHRISIRRPVDALLPSDASPLSFSMVDRMIPHTFRHEILMRRLDKGTLVPGHAASWPARATGAFLRSVTVDDVQRHPTVCELFGRLCFKTTPRDVQGRVQRVLCELSPECWRAVMEFAPVDRSEVVASVGRQVRDAWIARVLKDPEQRYDLLSKLVGYDELDEATTMALVRILSEGLLVKASDSVQLARCGLARALRSMQHTLDPKLQELVVHRAYRLVKQTKELRLIVERWSAQVDRPDGVLPFCVAKLTAGQPQLRGNTFKDVESLVKARNEIMTEKHGPKFMKHNQAAMFLAAGRSGGGDLCIPETVHM